MATVDVDNSSLLADLRAKSVSLV